MMTTDEMRTMLVDVESDRVERTISTTNTDKFGRNFGGGCLELMPSEVGGIYLSYREENEQIFDTIDLTKNLLICNVKKDNWEQYLDGTAKLYYFMAYLSGKGIRDLYYIKIARLGYRKEGQENEDKNDLRLVFEIERVGQLLDDYKKVKLEIWRTFTDTTMESIMKS